jgi:hypothetical protein
MVTLPTAALQTFPAHIEKNTLLRLLEETQARETLLRQTVRRLEQKYQCSLEELESRLAQGRGREHPDWEDSIEWRNGVEMLQRTQLLQSLLEWLVNSLEPSPTL